MKPPTMPLETAEQNPDAWEKFWADREVYEVWAKNERNREYRQKYYGEKTKQRQIAKMKNLMEKYPEVAEEFYLEYIKK